MPYRSRKQDRDQQIEKRINDSYRYAKPSKSKHKPDLRAIEIMQQNPGITYFEALDLMILEELTANN